MFGSNEIMEGKPIRDGHCLENSWTCNTVAGRDCCLPFLKKDNI